MILINEYLLLIGVVIMICIISSKFIEKIAVPSLLIFLALGMCFGENGIFKIPFDNYALADIICSVSLVFIMFYGGFGTNTEEAKPVAVKAILLSSFGTVLTACFVGVFIHYVFKLEWIESLLIGSVIASTDAASVFNILRSKNLSLKYNTSSLLEVESGSNDPFSYMLTVSFISVAIGGEVSFVSVVVKQLLIGVAFGVISGKGVAWVINKFDFGGSDGRTIFVFAAAIVSYAFPVAIGGNGYLSVYLCGIILGSCEISRKKYLVHFFDIITSVAQVVIFFLLGLLVTPSELPSVFVPAALIMLFMTFVARPVVVSLILLPLKSKLAQIGVVSWAGLRGVASIVFAITAVLNNVPMKYNIFNLVFCIVLLSISLQGTILPWVSKKLRMIDYSSDVNKTFNDYQEESSIDFIKIDASEENNLVNKKIKDIGLPGELLVVMILRNGKNIVPNGETDILMGDKLIVAAQEFEEEGKVGLREVSIGKSHKWKDKALSEISIPKGTLIVMIKRNNISLIPGGSTKIAEGDTLVVANTLV